MSPLVRFAPSPTGLLHLGNLRTAWLNWGFAKARGGKFLLRFDDTDRSRSRDLFVDAARADLRWTGIHPDAEERQSERTRVYEDAFDRLVAAGRVYPAYESDEALERARRLQRAGGRPPVYDRSALRIGEADRARLAADGVSPHWRFLLNRTGIGWDDLVRGAQAIDTAALSDPVVRRADGTFLYSFTSVVDDAALGITHVIRGEDHVTNTAAQLEIFEALGAQPPVFAHHNLLTAGDAAALSKRAGSLSLETLREAGLEGVTVAAYAVLIGSGETLRPVADTGELAGLVDLGSISRSPARVDAADLYALNTRLLHALPFEAVAERLAAMGVDGGAAFWLAIRGNVGVLAEARDWRDVVGGDIAVPAVGEPALLRTALDLLPPDPWDGATFRSWTKAISEVSGRKGKALFEPLRLALTGRPSGPELAALLPLIGAARVRGRLETAARD